MIAALVLVVLSACADQHDSAAEPPPPTATSNTTTTTSTAGTLSAAPQSPAAPTAPTTPPPSPVSSASSTAPATPPPPLATADPATASPAGPPETSSAAVPAAGFTSTISPIDDALATRMGTSWRPGCPVALADLRYLTVGYRGFDGAEHQGELVVAASVAPDVLDIFRSLYDDGYPIASLRLVDDFGGSDGDSMAADNSSAFNCRAVTGGGGFSEHSYGTAIDLNPVQNPYLNGASVLPDEGRPYADRHPAPGVIEAGDDVVTAFAAHGWKWGGAWTGPIDYQHFSLSGH